MKKIIEFLKSFFKKEQVSTPATYAELKQELKAVQEAEASAPVVEEAPKKVARKNVATNPAALAGNEAPKKKKRYYKPKNKA